MWNLEFEDFFGKVCLRVFISQMATPRFVCHVVRANFGHLFLRENVCFETRNLLLCTFVVFACSLPLGYMFILCIFELGYPGSSMYHK